MEIIRHINTLHIFVSCVSCSMKSLCERKRARPGERNETYRGKENVVPPESKCNPVMMKENSNQGQYKHMQTSKENPDPAHWHQVNRPKLLSLSNVAGSVEQSLESADYEEELSSLPSCLPSPVAGLLSPFPDRQENLITCVVEPEGSLALRLRAGVVLDIFPSMALRLQNTRQDTTLALSSCTSQLALVHPVGRLLQYASRIEVQVEDMISVKNAKIHPKGVSFTANNMALVYLLDEAGARSTSDMFHDLYATHIADTLFAASKGVEEVQNIQGHIRVGVQLLEQAQYWRDSVDHWVIGDVEVSQTKDGLVTVQRRVAGDTITLKTSPNNGKVRYDSRHLQVCIIVCAVHEK